MKNYPIPQIEEGDFFETINDAIKEKRHASYLRFVLKDYKKYKDFFIKTAFATYNPRGYIYQFKVTFKEDRKVWRNIEIKGNQTFEDFADSIIDSMNWGNDHMHRFTWLDKELNSCKFSCSRYVIYFDAEGWEDNPFPTLKTNQVRIDDIDYDKFPKLYFEFDFGEGYEFDIEIKGIRGPKTGEVKSSFPRITKENGEPPEQYPNYECKEDNHDNDELLDIKNDHEFQELARLMRITRSKQSNHDDGNILK